MSNSNDKKIGKPVPINFRLRYTKQDRIARKLKAKFKALPANA